MMEVSKEGCGSRRHCGTGRRRRSDLCQKLSWTRPCEMDEPHLLSSHEPNITRMSKQLVHIWFAALRSIQSRSIGWHGTVAFEGLRAEG